MCPSITKCPQEMAKHDFRSFGASDKNHFYHLYWACILGANRGDTWRKIKCHGKIQYCVLASPNVPRRWPNTILDHLAPVISGHRSREKFHQEIRHDHSQFYDQSSPHFRRSYDSPSSSLSEEEVRMKRSKAFRQILDIKNPEYFDGSNKMKYLPWKIALQKEVSHLEIDPTQWLELIKFRTRSDAREIVDRACAPLLETSPERTLNRVWKFLNRRFKTPQKPSQDILSNLLYGTQIADRNVKGLSDFADLCDSAADLMKDSPGLSASLNEITTQDAIVNRLPPTLRHKWFRHQCDDLDIEGTVAFSNFLNG